MQTKQDISNFIKRLQSIAESPNQSLQKAVAEEVLGSYEAPKDIECFFTDLLQHGCVSGMVSSLIYYNDTEKFFDEHYHEIMELKEEYEDATGQPMTIPYQLKNHLAWFGFEEMARRLWEAE